MVKELCLKWERGVPGEFPEMLPELLEAGDTEVKHFTTPYETQAVESPDGSELFYNRLRRSTGYLVSVQLCGDIRLHVRLVVEDQAPHLRLGCKGCRHTALIKPLRRDPLTNRGASRAHGSAAGSKPIVVNIVAPLQGAPLKFEAHQEDRDPRRAEALTEL